MPVRQGKITRGKRAEIAFDARPIIRAMAIQCLTLKALAKKIGGTCSVNAIWRITNGKATRPAHLQAACKVLKVRIEDCYPLPESAERTSRK